MARRHVYVLIVVILLVGLLSGVAYADVNSGVVCARDADCNDLIEDQAEQYYCHLSFRTCFLKPVSTAPATAATPAQAAAPVLSGAATAAVPTAATDAKIQVISNDVAVLKSDATNIKQEISSIQVVINTIQNRLTQLERDNAVVKGSTGSASQQINTLGTGLAGLQVELNATQTDVASLEQDVAGQQQFSSVLKALFFILLAVAMALGVIYYLNQGKAVAVEPKVVNYITKHIKEGKKFPFIKESLLKAGWGEQEILQAYKATTRQNYLQYIQQRLPGKPGMLSQGAAVQRPGRQPAIPSGRKPSSDKNKMVNIAIVTVLLLIGVFFLLSGTVGKAVFYQQQVSDQTREVTQAVSCTPPQILTPDEDNCCDDLNANNICDHNEREVAPPVVEGSCTDNLQCGSDKSCINGRCMSLLEVYKGSPVCGKICNYYTVVVETSDGETYNVKPKRGSYTCVGALEWKVMENNDHCQGEKPVIPIMVIYKEPGSILSEEVITLRRRESKTLQHPTLPSCALTLTVNEIYELCT